VVRCARLLRIPSVHRHYHSGVSPLPRLDRNRSPVPADCHPLVAMARCRPDRAEGSEEACAFLCVDPRLSLSG
jgi:hypothetical protein